MTTQRQATAPAIRQVVADVAKRSIDDVQPGSRLMDDLGIRSFSRVELAVVIEDQFGVALSDAQVMRLKTVADVIAAVERR